MKKRLNSVTIIFALLFAVIVNKIISERNVQRLERAFSEIYEDRLVVESYIYELTHLFYKKKILLLKYRENYKDVDADELRKQTSEIVYFTQKYDSTRFTENERKIFEKLQGNIRQLQNEEEALVPGKDQGIDGLQKLCELSVGELKLLSSIQLREGNLLREKSKKVLSSSSLAGQLEWTVFLVIMILLVSVLRKRKVTSDVPSEYRLN